MAKHFELCPVPAIARILACRFLFEARGNITIAAALALPVLLAAGGIAVSYSSASSARSNYQQALDAAVLAGATIPFSDGVETRTRAAMDAFSANTLDNYGALVTQANHVKFTADNKGVSGIFSGGVENPFGGFIGGYTIPIKVSARAEKMQSAPICVLTLNKTSKTTFFAYGNAEFEAVNCAVQANSANGAGMQIDGRHASAKARQLAVKGGYKGKGFTPTPLTGVEPTPDPYASLPVPKAGPCIDVAKKLIQLTVTLDPGTYCDGLNIGADSKVTLSPGIYVIKDGQFKIGSGATVNGQDVLIAFVGANSYLYMNGNSAMNLTSPSTGLYMNMQFMSDRVLSQSKFEMEWTTILGNAALKYDGVMYLPEQQVWAEGEVDGKSPSMIMVADQVWWQGNQKTTVKQENSRNLPVKAAVTFETGARLVR